MDKDEVREFAVGLGADIVGFASIDDYQSRRSPDPKRILPGVQSLVVMGFREIRGAVESEFPRVGMVCRLGSLEIALNTAFRMSRFLEKKTRTTAVPISPSYPLEMSRETKGTVADVSLRHAAVAAGLALFGRHNLVINPELGTQVLYTAVLSELSFTSDQRIEETLCHDCSLCVEACPAKALEEEGKTDVVKCLRVSQPLGINGVIRYFSEMLEKPKEEQKRMLRAPFFWDLYQASFMGFTYSCNKCVAVCPIGSD